MAYAGSSTFPGATTFPGITTPPGVVTEGLAEARSAPQGVNPRDTLLVKFTPPTGVGGSIVRDCPADLVWDNTAPGGHGSMSCTIDWPDGWPPPDGLVVAALAQVIDGRSGQVIWHGQVVDPGYTRTSTGASHRVQALGFYTVLDTQAASLAYVDRDLGNWLSANDYPGGSAQIVDDISLGQHSGDWVEPTTSVVEMVYPDGSKLDASTPSHMTMQYLPGKYASAGQDIVLVLGTVKSRGNDGGFFVDVQVRNAAGTTTQKPFHEVYTDVELGVDFTVRQAVGAWTMGDARVAELRFVYNSVDATAIRDWWLRWGNMAVVFQKVNRFGDVAGTPSTSVTAAQIVDDVIGRLLRTKLDISSAIAAPTTLVEQAAWWGGVTAAEVFDFIEDLNPANYWAVWEPQESALPRFEYLPWAVHPRYIIPPDAATISLAGGGDELANRAVVSYQTSNGVPASVVISGTVPELSAAGLTRTIVVDLTGEGTLSRNSAISKGTDALAAANIQRSSGTATVFGPVFDVKAGRMVEPFEIRAGWPVVLGGGVLRADGGTAYSLKGTRDGRSTFRLTEASYSASSASMELTLDGGGRSLFNRVKAPVPKRRKAKKKRKNTDLGDSFHRSRG